MLLATFASEYGWTATQIDEIGFNEAMEQLVYIRKSNAMRFDIQRRLMASAISLCFGESKQDQILKEMKRMLEDVFEEPEITAMDAKELHHKFEELYPVYKRVKAEVKD